MLVCETVLVALLNQHGQLIEQKRARIPQVRKRGEADSAFFYVWFVYQNRFQFHYVNKCFPFTLGAIRRKLDHHCVFVYFCAGFFRKSDMESTMMLFLLAR